MKIFISSTYRDLAEFREIIRLALETSGYEFRGMEYFPAQTLTPLEVCLAGVDECDVYVGIIGGLYGSAPLGRTFSYTELEYRHASKLNKPRILLLLDKDAQVRPSQIEQDAKRLPKLEAFKNRLKSKHTVQSFKDGNEAAWKILAALRLEEARISGGAP